MSKSKFTVSDGLALQMVNLITWKKKLNPKTFEALQEFVKKENTKLTENSNGFDVVRGDSLTTFVLNYQPK